MLVLVSSGDPWDLRGEPVAVNGDWMTNGVGVATLITRYRGACAASDEAIGALAMADTGAQEIGSYTLRWALFHVLEDTMRHAGQAHSSGSRPTVPAVGSPRRLHRDASGEGTSCGEQRKR